MIHALTANDERFNAVRFRPGMNVVMADRTESSSEQDSRNGLGKSSLVHLIQYCLGGRLPDQLGGGTLGGWSFSLTLDIEGRPTTLTRSVDAASRVLVEGDWNPPGITLDRQLTIDDLTSALGHAMFDLDRGAEGKYTPTFRGLISYFARRGQAAYVDPLKHFHSQPGYQQQVLHGFLADLNWEYPRDQRLLDEELSNVRALKRATEEGVLEGVVGSSGELNAKRVQLERRLGEIRDRIDDFRVHPQYRSLEMRAEALATRIRELTSQLAVKRRLLHGYEEGILEEDVGMRSIQLEELYREVSLQLPELVTSTLDDVRDFHERLRRERTAYLESEMGRLGESLQSLNHQISALENKRADILTLLTTHGDLEELESLREQAAQIQLQLGGVLDQSEMRRRIDHGADDVRKRRTLNTEEARREFEDKANQRDRLVELFDRFWERLYGVGGRLIIDVTASGYSFGWEVEREGSQGVDRMKIFAYDLAVGLSWAEQKKGPEFLVHDSIVWDGVDERQIAAALRLANDVSEESDLQYICCINSDVVPGSVRNQDFMREAVVLRLTDAQDAGRLFGFRF